MLTQVQLEELANSYFNQGREYFRNGIGDKALFYFSVARGFYRYLEDLRMTRLTERFMEKFYLSPEEMEAAKRYGERNTLFLVNLVEIVEQILRHKNIRKNGEGQES